MRAFTQSLVEPVRYPSTFLDTGLRVRAANPTFHPPVGARAVEARVRPRNYLDAGRLDIPGLVEQVERVVTAGRKALRLNARRVICHGDGTPMILMTSEGMTDRKRPKEALRRRTDKLEVRDRTAQLEAASKEMEAFCSSVSRVSQAPFWAIDGFVQELLRSHPDRVDDAGRHYPTLLRAISRRTAVFVDDLFQLSRLSRAQLKGQAVDLSAPTNTVIADLRQREPHPQVTFSSPGSSPPRRSHATVVVGWGTVGRDSTPGTTGRRGCRWSS